MKRTRLGVMTNDQLIKEEKKNLDNIEIVLPQIINPLYKKFTIIDHYTNKHGITFYKLNLGKWLAENNILEKKIEDYKNAKLEKAKIQIDQELTEYIPTDIEIESPTSSRQLNLHDRIFRSSQLLSKRSLSVPNSSASTVVSSIYEEAMASPQTIIENMIVEYDISNDFENLQNLKNLKSYLENKNSIQDYLEIQSIIDTTSLDDFLKEDLIGFLTVDIINKILNFTDHSIYILEKVLLPVDFTPILKNIKKELYETSIDKNEANGFKNFIKYRESYKNIEHHTYYSIIYDDDINYYIRKETTELNKPQNIKNIEFITEKRDDITKYFNLPSTQFNSFLKNYQERFKKILQKYTGDDYEDITDITDNKSFTKYFESKSYTYYKFNNYIITNIRIIDFNNFIINDNIPINLNDRCDNNQIKNITVNLWCTNIRSMPSILNLGSLKFYKLTNIPKRVMNFEILLFCELYKNILIKEELCLSYLCILEEKEIEEIEEKKLLEKSNKLVGSNKKRKTSPSSKTDGCNSDLKFEQLSSGNNSLITWDDTYFYKTELLSDKSADTIESDILILKNLQEQKSPHLLEYVNDFECKLSKNNNYYQIALSPNNSKKSKILITKKIECTPGLMTIDDLINFHKECSENTSDSKEHILLKFNKFAVNLINISKNTRFIHNDCHFGNVLVDKNDNFVLIDYGRSYININDKLPENVWRMIPNSTINIPVLFDLGTICYNIQKQARFEHYNSIMKVYENGITIPSTRQLLNKKIISLIEKSDKNKILFVYGLGFIVDYILFIMEAYGKLKSTSSGYLNFKFEKIELEYDGKDDKQDREKPLLINGVVFIDVYDKHGKTFTSFIDQELSKEGKLEEYTDLLQTGSGDDNIQEDQYTILLKKINDINNSSEYIDIKKLVQDLYTVEDEVRDLYRTKEKYKVEIPTIVEQIKISQETNKLPSTQQFFLEDSIYKQDITATPGAATAAGGKKKNKIISSKFSSHHFNKP